MLPFPMAMGRRRTDGYNIERSLLFDGASYLSRTPGSAGNRKTWTWSGWVKRGNIGAGAALFSAVSGATQQSTIFFRSTDDLQFYSETSGGTTIANVQTQSLFRDMSAWYHIMVVLDASNATASDRIKIYVNGELQSVNTTTAISNADHNINATISHAIAREATKASYLNGYIAETYLIDGQALTPDDFGEINPTTGQWVPKAYTGTYDTNGFYLPFDNNASTTTLGEDASGNGNDWTLTGFTVDDSVEDTPTNVFPTLNPLETRHATSPSQANLRFAPSGSSPQVAIASLPIPDGGQWYAECVKGSATGNMPIGLSGPGRTETYLSQNEAIAYWNNGQIHVDGTVVQSGLTTLSNGQAVGIAVDADAQTVQFYVAGSAVGSAVSYAGKSQVWFAGGNYVSGLIYDWNFGQKPFAHTPPAGFLPLSTKNLPDPLIANPKLHFDVSLHEGTAAAQSIILPFQPDLSAFKDRDAAASWAWYDSDRGPEVRLESNTTDGEATSDDGVTAFNVDGVTLGAQAQVNASGRNFVGYHWKKGVTPGYDSVAYTGNGIAGRTVAHGLGDVPAMMMMMSRASARSHVVYHQGITTPQSNVLYLNLTNAQSALSGAFNDTLPDASNITLGTYCNWSGEDYVAYLFAEVPGFSAFGRYTGNGSTNGPFVHLGFRPAWVMIKRVDSVGNWTIYDALRDGYNGANKQLYPNLSNAEGTSEHIDLVSSGFKLRTTDSSRNANGGTYIYAAFAQAPVKFANAA